MPSTFLRHTLATLAYRAAKVLRCGSQTSAGFQAGAGTRSPEQILAHMGDLMDWGLSLACGKQAWHDSEPLPWPQEVERFFTALTAFDSCLASDVPLGCTEEQLFQGPVADALTHLGQIALLHRMAGVPVRPENYMRADITAGRTGQDQAPPRKEL